MAVELGTHQRSGALEAGIGRHTVRHPGLRLRLGKIEGVCAVGFHQTGGSATFQRSQHMGAGIMRSARPGHEGIARLDLAAVGA